MQFNNTAGVGIIQRCEALSLLGDTGISGNTTLLRQFTGAVNQAYLEIVSQIMKVDTNWKFDDFNYNDYPEAPINLFASQRDYTLPVATVGANIATVLRINEVWVLNTSGLRQRLELMSANEEFDYISTGTPTKYRTDGKSIYMNIRPSATAVTLTGGLIIKFQRIPDAFTITDTTQQPGFIETFHELIPLKASAMFLLPINPQLSSLYSSGNMDAPARYESMTKQLISAYRNMNDDIPNVISFEKVNPV